MDISSVLLCLPDKNMLTSEKNISLTGAFLPANIPTMALPKELQIKNIIKNSKTPLNIRLQLALLHDENIAWKILDSLHPAIVIDNRTQHIIDNWWKKKYPQITKRPFFAIGFTNNQKREISKNLHNIEDIFSSIENNIWHGKIVFQKSKTDKQYKINPRSIAPIITVPLKYTEKDISDAIIDLYFKRMTANKWEEWLVSGIKEASYEKMLGRGPSPRAMRKIRQKAGVQSIKKILKNEEQNKELSKAICSIFIHSRRRYKLYNFLYMIKNKVDIELALKIIYKIKIKDFVGDDL